ncbi:MAG: UxaA family hydrolase [Negativicutes bacterium]|nr:UxaA family hydrolase [Negativicutes bacterium]
MEKNQAIIMKDGDNVATAVTHIEAGSTVSLAGEGSAICLKISETILFGHKFAIVAIPQGRPVVKYGEIIGAATRDIAAGEHVHVHNVESIRGRGDKG